MARSATAGTQKSAANDTVAIRLRVDLREPGGGTREHRYRLYFAGNFAVIDIFCHRQYHPAVVADGISKDAIRVRIARVRLGQYDVESDGLCAFSAELVNQGRMHRPRPREATDPPQAFLIDADDDDVVARRALYQLNGAIIERLVKAKKPIPFQRSRAACDQQCADHHPFANRRVTPQCGNARQGVPLPGDGRWCSGRR